MYHLGREWPYKNLKPKIICEKMLIDENGNIPDDYKIFCFHGEPKVIALHKNRFFNHTETFYDLEWNKLEIATAGIGSSDVYYEKPKNLRKMISIARKLAFGMFHVRIDLYNIEGNIFFGEFTLYDGSGIYNLEPAKYDMIWGSWLKINLN